MRKKSNLSSVFYKNPGIWLGIIIAGVIAAFVFLRLSISSHFSREATLLLAFENDGKGRMFKGEVVEDMTIFDALMVSSEAGDIKLRYTVTSEGKVEIIELDGYVNINSRKPTFYMNGKQIVAESINSTVVRPGDRVEVRLE